MVHLAVMNHNDQYPGPLSIEQVDRSRSSRNADTGNFSPRSGLAKFS